MKNNLLEKIMEREFSTDDASQEEGVEELSLLIKQAGNEARTRRKKALDEHFIKLKQVVADAVSHQNSPKPI